MNLALLVGVEVNRESEQRRRGSPVEATAPRGTASV